MRIQHGLIVIAFVIAGCASEAEATTVSLRDVAGTGNVLVDGSGHALYTTDQESTGKVTCTSADCVAVWLPLTVAEGDQPTGPDDLPGKLSTIDRPDGKKQVAYEGKPIYTFTLDREPGVVNGNGASDTFAGTKFTWRAVVPGGGATTPAPETGGGYGY